VGGFDAKLRRVEDADFAIRLALMGGHFVGTTQTLFVQYSTSATDKSPERNLEAQQRLACKHKVYLESVGRFDYAKRWPRLRYWHFKHRYDRFLAEFTGLLLRYPRAVTWHLLNTGPRRLLHEARMRRRTQGRV
jgi:GT2 family glycosyltransferase